MNVVRRALLWAALIAIVLLAVFSIYGAFLGADRAQAFFNTLPLIVYWLALSLLLIVGILVFRRLLRVPALLLMHLGCVLVLAGGMWGSKPGHALRNRLFGTERIPAGQMAIRERSEDDRVRIDDSNDVGELPFLVRLKDFRMEYYQPGTLIVQDRDGREWRLPAEPGRTLSLTGELGTIRVTRVFENFKIGMEGDERVPYDAPGGENPAVAVAIARPDGTTTTRYVFERFPGHPHPDSPLGMSYRRMVRDYISELEIIRDGEVAAAKDIEVNHPLHYGGYHFYQSSYGTDQLGEYTILSVVSDAGLNVVYLGYALLIAGIVWHFWAARLVRTIRNRNPCVAAAGPAPPTEREEPHGD